MLVITEWDENWKNLRVGERHFVSCELARLP